MISKLNLYPYHKPLGHLHLEGRVNDGPYKVINPQKSVAGINLLFFERIIFLSKRFSKVNPHLTSDVLFPKKISTINQGVHQKLEPPELRLVKTRKKSHCRIRRYRRLDFTTVFTK